MKKLIVSAAATIFFALGASDVSACSCLVDDNQSTSKKVRTSYNQATAVFYGEVTEIKPKPGAVEGSDPNLEPVTVKFKVYKFWKGAMKDEIIVTTAANSAMCGFNFETGRRYTVYANDAGNGLQTTICTRTAASDPDAKYLNKIKKPKEILRRTKVKFNK
ncbi:MAG TPA: hypothetical protein VIL74_04895 [Pyrinomonadaceae bacterium]|jgi:hypothetical protein